MKVALAHDYLLEMGGAERVLLVLAEIFPDAPIFTLLYDPANWDQYLPRQRVRVSSLHKLPGFVRRQRRWLLPFYPLVTEGINLRDFDVVISSSAGFIKGVITRPKTVHISYCHTPTRFLWDLYHYYAQNGRMNWLKSPFLHYLRLWDLAASQRVDYFVANSRNTQRRIKKYYNRESTVIYPPVDPVRSFGATAFKPTDTTKLLYDKMNGEFCSNTSNGVDVSQNSVPAAPRKEKLDVPFGDYFLISSRLFPYKRIDLAVEAFNKIDLPLIVIGEGPDRRRLEKRAKSNVKFLGWQPEEIKNLYLKHCAAFVFPGEEDFGIAPVEAMSFGKPVLAYRAGGLLESVIEGKTGEFFDEDSPESLTAGLMKLKGNLKNYDSEFIKKHAQKFGKKRFIAEIKSFVEKAYNEGGIL